VFGQEIPGTFCINNFTVDKIFPELHQKLGFLDLKDEIDLLIDTQNLDKHYLFGNIQEYINHDGEKNSSDKYFPN